MKLLALLLVLNGCVASPGAPPLGEQLQPVASFTALAEAKLDDQVRGHAPVIAVTMFETPPYQIRSNGNMPPRTVVLLLGDQTTRYYRVDCSMHSQGGPQQCQATLLQ